MLVIELATCSYTACSSGVVKPHGRRSFSNIAGPDLLAECRQVVLEGLKGLLLDQGRGVYPNLTQSHTAFLNALDIAVERRIGDRCHLCDPCLMTRYGAGHYTN